MGQCPSCGTELADGNRFCPMCGKRAAGETFATQTVAPDLSPRNAPGNGESPRPASVSSATRSSSRFAAGTVLAGRYRIVALLGKGGMGEVYRAEDLTLEQQVALKFLPEGVTEGAPAMARFRNEVRIARQVSHPNVCRVYDFGEIDGQVFLSMEYVDGEDLASLLRRIGRLPVDKGVEIARKLCAGLAAAHEKGVLHRDLKPSNIMLDSRGQVLLTDFGLASLAVEMTGAEVRNGTPAYMAPEQLAGKEVTVQSDLYALALVLYEIFTGKRPFEASSLAELIRAQTDSTPASLTSLVRDLDPAVERVIIRCLDPEPSRRPRSALAVAAALPGGDPLTAALAAGEVPSPKMVAAAGQGVGLSPQLAIALLAGVLVLLGGFYALQVQRGALERTVSYSPDVLSQKARDLVRQIGFDSVASDEAYGFAWDQDFLKYAGNHDKPVPDWTKTLAQRPAALQFWYRQSPYPLTALSYHSDLLTPGVVDPTDPPPILSGMIGIQLDSQGRLLYLERIPDQQQKPGQEKGETDWGVLFRSAGLDETTFQAAEPVRTWLATSDTRQAWTGVWPESGRPLRVEAAALAGKPVAFALISPWTVPDRTPEQSGTATGQLIIIIAVSFAIIFGAWRMGRRNMKKGLGDRDGARRLAGWIAWVQMGLWLCDSHFNASIGTYGMVILAMSTAVFYGFIVYVMYIALEPQVRRRWPRTLISWSAMLTGQWRDPIVGRDVLVGVLLGIGTLAISQAVDAVALGATMSPHLGTVDVLQGFRSTVGTVFFSMPHGIRDTLTFSLLLFLLRAILRNEIAAGAALAIIFASAAAVGSAHPVIDAAEALVAYGLVAFLVWRFGLLALGMFILSNSLAGQLQPTFHTGAWYFPNTIFLIACLVGLAVWGCYTSIGGQKLWKTGLLED